MHRISCWLCAVCAALVVLLVGAPTIAQGRARRAARVCVPGAQSACACVGGSSGVQRCNGEGTALLACECAPTATAPVAPAPERVTTRQEPTASPAPWSAAHTERRWYGWQILLPDIAGGLLSLVGGFVPGPAGFGIAITGSAVALFGGPIVHWAHGHIGRGFGSLFGLRVGLPVLGALLGLGAGVAAGNTTASIVLGTSVGAGIGSLTGFVIDIAVLAYDSPAAQSAVADDDRARRARRARFGVALAPTVDVVPGQWSRVGVIGRF